MVNFCSLEPGLLPWATQRFVSFEYSFPYYIFTMDVVLEKIHYNPECFSKIVEDFEDYVECAEPGVFQKAFDDLKKSAIFPEEGDIICQKIIT